jgi:soluble lytic murein transglycosylase-like protein
MTTRSIIDIEVRDQAFKDFSALFAKYQTQLGKLPGSWDKVDAAIKQTTNPFKQIHAILSGTVEQLNAARTAQEKLRLSAQASGKVFGVMATSTGKLARNIKSATLDLLRWGSLTAVFSGLLGAGGLFGLNRLAAAAGNSRREAQGLGVTPGEHEAAKINYQKLVDVDSMLTKINEAKWDVTKRSAFAAAGLQTGDWENRNAADILKTLVPQLKTRFDQIGGTKQGADATGLTQFVDMETLTRLKNVTREEIDAAGKRYDADVRLLSISDRAQRAWQDFSMQLQRAGAQIENSFLKGLAPLTPHLEKLSAAVAHAVDVFLASPKIGKWIDTVGVGLQKFAKYLTSDDFTEDVKSFFDALDELGGAIYGVARTIGKVFNAGNERGLKASQYRELEQLDKLDHKLAQTLEHALKNPDATAANKFSMWSLSHPQADLTAALGKASPEAQRLARGIQNETQTLRADVPLEQRVKPMINLPSVRADKSALRGEAARQMDEAIRNAATTVNKFADLEKQFALPPGLLASVEKQESRGNANARSPAGAEGPFQFMPAAWKQYGAGGDIHSERDSARAAARFYRDLLDKYQGDLKKALAGYNWGAGNVDKHGVSEAPAETRKYIASILADMGYRQSARGGSTSTSTPNVAPQVAARAPVSPPIQINISKAAGADVNVQVLALSSGP